MPILYSVVSRGPTILAKFAECVGNFAEVTEQIIRKIQPENHKLTYSHGNYLIHYICENRIIYMCITDDEFERARAFLFLSDIKQRFIATYGLQVATAIAYAMNAEFSTTLATKMSYFSQSNEVDAISRVHGQIDELKNIMVKNIGEFLRTILTHSTASVLSIEESNSLLAFLCEVLFPMRNIKIIENLTDSIKDRGERLELLVNKTENLRNCSVSFRKQSRNLARQMFWKNVRMYVIVGLIIIFVIYVIISMACGGLAWQSCIKK